MSESVRYDDPVADALAWRRANERRERLASEGAARLTSAALAPAELCHYCGKHPGVTRDHIVPQSRLATRRYRSVVNGGNVVPACHRCNQRKADARSDCGCEQCIAAWLQYGPDDWHLIPVVALVRVRP